MPAATITDGYGQPLPFRDGNGIVALAQNQFVSIDADPLGGVPFNEDVRITQWLPFGKNGIPNTPASENAAGWRPQHGAG